MYDEHPMTQVYKVVQSRNKKLYSAVAYTGAAKIRYIKNKFSRPNKKLEELGFAIFAFNTLEAANNFFQKEKSYPGKKLKIYLAETSEIINSRSHPSYCAWVWDSLDQAINEAIGKGRVYKTLYWPDGTIFCKDLKLIRRIK